MNNNPEVIVIKEKRENVDKMKQELAKKEKQYTTLKNVGEALSAFGTPVLIGSLLSPFDFAHSYKSLNNSLIFSVLYSISSPS